MTTIRSILVVLLLAVLGTMGTADEMDDLLGGTKTPTTTGKDDLLSELGLKKSRIHGLKGEKRKAAIQEILSEKDPEKVREDLIEILLSNEDESDIQLKAVHKLSVCGGTELIEPAKQLITDLSPLRRAIGARLLGASRSPDQVVPLLKSAADRATLTEEEKFTISLALAKLASPSGIPVLKRFAGEKPEVTVTGKILPDKLHVRTARLGLLLTGDSGSASTCFSDMEFLLQNEQASKHNIKVYAATWTPRQIQAERQQLEWTEEALTLGTAVLQLKNATVMEALINHLQKNPSSPLLDQLYISLDEAITRENAAAYCPLLKLQPTQLRGALCSAIRNSGNTDAVKSMYAEIQQLSKSEDYLDRSDAVNLSRFIPPKSRTILLQNAMRDPSAFVRETATREQKREHTDENENMPQP